MRGSMMSCRTWEAENDRYSLLFCTTTCNFHPLLFYERSIHMQGNPLPLSKADERRKAYLQQSGQLPKAGAPQDDTPQPTPKKGSAGLMFVILLIAIAVSALLVMAYVSLRDNGFLEKLGFPGTAAIAAGPVDAPEPPAASGPLCPTKYPSFMPFINSVIAEIAHKDDPDAASYKADPTLLPTENLEPTPICVERKVYLQYIQLVAKYAADSKYAGQDVTGLQFLTDHYAKQSGKPERSPILMAALQTITPAKNAEGQENPELGWVILPGRGVVAAGTPTPFGTQPPRGSLPPGGGTGTPVVVSPTPLIEIVPPTFVFSPTPYIWAVIVEETSSSGQNVYVQTPMAAPTNSPYWCPWTNLWVTGIDFYSIGTTPELNAAGLQYYELLWFGDAYKLRGMPEISGMDPDGNYHAYNPVCVDRVYNVPPMNNLDGIGSSLVPSVSTNLQLRIVPRCSIDPNTGVGCGEGGVWEKKLADGLYAWPLNIPQQGIINPQPTVGPDTEPSSRDGQVYSIGSWVQKSWAAGPNYSYHFYTSGGILAIEFVTQDTSTKVVDLTQFKDHWNGSQEVIFGTCENVPQPRWQIPGYTAFCITQFH